MLPVERRCCHWLATVGRRFRVVIASPLLWSLRHILRNPSCPGVAVVSWLSGRWISIQTLLLWVRTPWMPLSERWQVFPLGVPILLVERLVGFVPGWRCLGVHRLWHRGFSCTLGWSCRGNRPSSCTRKDRRLSPTIREIRRPYIPMILAWVYSNSGGCEDVQWCRKSEVTRCGPWPLGDRVDGRPGSPARQSPMIQSPYVSR